MLSLVACALITPNTDDPDAPITPEVTATFGALPVTQTTPTSSAVPTEPALPSQTPMPTTTPPPTPTENPFPWTDELLTMYGICFEAALDASGEVFVLRSAEEHIRLYNLADNSGLCRRPVQRAPFDFQDGERILAGTWSVGMGCTARHDIQNHSVDADNILMLEVTFITEGDCNYELVRPFWIGVQGVRDVQITVTDASPSP